MIVRNKISENLLQSDSKMFWSSVSKLNKKKNTVCAMIDNKVGNEACEAFYNKYKKLYNKNPSPNINKLHQIVKGDITGKCCNCEEGSDDGNNDDNNGKHMHKVSVGMVKDAIKNLKKGQYDEHTKLMSDSSIL